MGKVIPARRYWHNRFKYLEKASHGYGIKAYMEIEPAFLQAQREIQMQIDSWYARFAANNNVTLAEARKMLSSRELSELRWDVNEYIKYGRQTGMIDTRWMRQLENASAKFHISRLEALQIRTQQALEVAFGNELDAVDKMARKVFSENYYHSIFEVQKGFNIGWEVGQIDSRKLNNIIKKPWATDGQNFSSRIWTRKQQMVGDLHQELTRTLVQGKAPDEAIRHMEKFVDSKVKNARNAASRLVMTEQAYFHSISQEEAFRDLDVERFEIIATLDSRTSEICQDMDGRHFAMADYEPGGTAPPFHPNCRSVTAPYFEDNYGGERAARGADGKTYYVPDNMKYKDWKDSMVDGNTEGLKIIQDAIDEQIELLNKYGNLSNVMLQGSSEELIKWSDLQKISNMNEKDILKEMSKNANNWETILANQTEETMQPFVDQLLNVATDEELGALNTWSGATYANMNRYMRYGINVDDISKNAAIKVETVLNKIQTTEEIIVRRGTGTKHIFEKMVGDWKNDPSVLIGQEFFDAGFTATSPLMKGGFGGAGANQAELFIKVPKGTHGAYIAQEAHNELEREFLLQRGYSYRIIKAEYRNNPLFPDEKDLKVWCEVILNE